jgi:LIVCS family branched-chain amino acid:cation transporter
MVFIPVMGMACLFGLIDGLSVAGFATYIPKVLQALWGMDVQMGWVLPVMATLVLAVMVDRLWFSKRGYALE